MRKVIVFGPAYLDRVARVDCALGDPPLDMSVDGVLRAEETGGRILALIDPAGGAIQFDLPDDWPGPAGRVALSRALGVERRGARVVSWHDDLGGMGAGYAKAFGGVLVSALGGTEDRVSQAVAALLAQHHIEHRPIRVLDQPADWTLLVTSAQHGDKLPVGFRGCHAALRSLGDSINEPCDLRVVAGLPNRLAREALQAPDARVRFFAPAARNVADRETPVASFSHAIDALACNHAEWHTMPDGEREAILKEVPLVAVTDGPRGSTVHYHDVRGARAQVSLAAFPRQHPPRDTNRAGEAYAATLVDTLLDAGWSAGPLDRATIERAAARASCAAALVLDRAGFGFPERSEVDRALLLGHVPDDDMGALR